MILVTGGNGFLGNHLVNYLNNKKQEVISSIRNTRGKNNILKNTILINFSEKIDKVSIPDSIETIVHTAGATL